MKRTTTARRADRVTRSGRVAAATDQVILRLPSGRELRIVPDDDPKELQRDAMYWAYVVRSRRRWAGTSRASESPIRRLVNEDGLKAIAAAKVVEVDIPYVTEAAGW